jgi:hypothetical protein
MHPGQLTLPVDVLAHGVLDDQWIMDIGHLAEPDMEVRHHELDAARHVIEAMSDGNRHLTSGLNKIKARNVVTVMLEEEGMVPLYVLRSSEMIFADGATLVVDLPLAPRHLIDVRKQHVLFKRLVNETGAGDDRPHDRGRFNHRHRIRAGDFEQRFHVCALSHARSTA